MPSLLSIYEVEKETGISAYTIRYYDKCGFFPHLLRDTSGARCFRSGDVRQLRLVDALRKSGLSIDEIKRFVALQDDSSKQHEARIILATCLEQLAMRRDELAACESFLVDTISQMEGESRL